jgi:hypothetical protein
MKPLAMLFAFSLLTGLSFSASAADYVCKGDSVEKSGSTHFKVRTSGSDYTVEKSGSTKGKAVKRGNKYEVEVSGSTKASIENGKIYKSGSTWASVSDAQRVFDCPDIVAATLWVLMQTGQL